MFCGKNVILIFKMCEILSFKLIDDWVGILWAQFSCWDVDEVVRLCLLRYWVSKTIFSVWF